MHIVISGAYGMGNLGDEAIFDSLFKDCRMASPDCVLSALVFDRQIFLKAHPKLVDDKNFLAISFFDVFLGKYGWHQICSLFKGWLAICRCDLFMFGGGGLFRNRISWIRCYLKPLFFAQMLHRKILVCCIGVDRIDDPEVIRLIRKIKPSTVFCLRDTASMENFLAVYGKSDKADVKVIPDPAFHIVEEPLAKRPHDGLVVGLNLSFWKADFSDKTKLDGFLKSMANALGNLGSHQPLKIIHLPTCPGKDGPLWKLLVGQLQTGITAEEHIAETPDDYILSLAEVDAFVGMRLHSLILSSNVGGLPTVAIAYDEKVENLFAMLDIEPLSIGQVTADPAVLENQLAEVISHNHTEVLNIPWNKIRLSSNEIKNVIKIILCVE